MYTEIESEFAPQFATTPIDFVTTYNQAVARVQHYRDDTIIKQAVRSILSEVLAEYSRSQGHTKAGRFFRFISRIFAPIVKVFK